jgi:hypothetical protein
VIVTLAAIVTLVYFRSALRRAQFARTSANPGMTADAAYDSALRLGRAGDHEASLPFYRAALAGSLGPAWTAHFNYASALYNTGLQVRERLGVPIPVTRSSIERVALMRASLAELDIAGELAQGTARERAVVVLERAARLKWWGLPWDALVQIRQAAAIVPADPRPARAAEEYARAMRDPLHEPAPPASPAPASGTRRP